MKKSKLQFKNIKLYHFALSFCILIFTFFISSQAHASVLSRAPSNLGLVGYWNFNEGTTTFAGDSSGNKNHGNLFNMASPPSATSGWTPNGKLGKALGFDGSDDFVGVSDNATLQLATSLTVSTWFKTTDTGSDRGIVRKDTVSGTRYLYGFAIAGACGEGAGKLSGQYYNGVCSKVASINNVNDGNWHHAVMTISGTTLTLYVDGASQGITTITGTQGVPTGELDIGAHPPNTAGGRAGFLNGSIDEVRIYNRALTAAEVKTLYQSNAAQYINPSNLGLVGYWNFNEGTTTFAGDSSGNKNHGNLFDMASPPSATSGWTPNGKFGNALNFDGSDDFVLIANESNFDFERTNSFSISAWVFLKVNGAGGILTKMEGTANIRGWNAFMRGGTVNPTFAFELRNTAGNRIAVYTTTEWPLNKWYHIVWTYNGTSAVSGQKIYVNSVNQTLTTLEDTLSATILQNISPQINGRGGATFLRANSIDEVRIYNRALSAAEVKTLYNQGR